MSRDDQTIMPIKSTSGGQTNSQSYVDTLSHGLTRWAYYSVSAGRARELATEFAQLNASVQTGAGHLQFDDEPSAFVAWLNTSATGVWPQRRHIARSAGGRLRGGPESISVRPAFGFARCTGDERAGSWGPIHRSSNPCGFLPGRFALGYPVGGPTPGQRQSGYRLRCRHYAGGPASIADCQPG